MSSAVPGQNAVGRRAGEPGTQRWVGLQDGGLGPEPQQESFEPAPRRDRHGHDEVLPIVIDRLDEVLLHDPACSRCELQRDARIIVRRREGTVDPCIAVFDRNVGHGGGADAVESEDPLPLGDGTNR